MRSFIATSTLPHCCKAALIFPETVHLSCTNFPLLLLSWRVPSSSSTGTRSSGFVATLVEGRAIFALVTLRDSTILMGQAWPDPYQDRILLLSSLGAPVSTGDHSDLSAGLFHPICKPGLWSSHAWPVVAHYPGSMCPCTCGHHMGSQEIPKMKQEQMFQLLMSFSTSLGGKE